MKKIDEEKAFKECLEVIEKNNLIFMSEVEAYTSFSKHVIYEHLLKDAEKADKLKSAINKNKVETKRGLRKKWYEKGNPITDVALYKLNATEEEREALNTNYTKSEIDAKVETNGTVEVIEIVKPHEKED